MMRFHQACRLARIEKTHGWAGIAAESGYADQAHLVREFVALAGESPTAWARRLALTDSRLTRPQRRDFGLVTNLQADSARLVHGGLETPCIKEFP